MKLKRMLLLHIPQDENNKKSMIQAAPIGLVGLGNYIKDNSKINVSICNLANFDSSIYKDVYEYINEKSFDIIAISLHWHFQSYNVIKMCRNIKEHCNGVKIILGGFTATWFAQEILNEVEEVDFIIKGEGEIPYLELIKSLKNKKEDLSEIPNLVWRKEKEVVSNNISFVADNEFLDKLNDWDLSIYDEEVSCYQGFTGGDMVIEDKSEQFFFLPIGRGCSLSCSYCAGAKENQLISFGRKKVSFRSPKVVINTIERIVDYGFDKFYICFDPPEITNEWYSEFFKLLREKEISISITFECYNLPNKKFIKEFSQSVKKDSSFLAFSPSSIIDKIRWEYTAQDYTFTEMEEILDYCEELKITVYTYFSLLPTVEDKEWKQFINKVDWMLKRESKYIKSGMMPIKMEPGAPWYINPEKYRIISKLKSFNDFYEYHKKYEEDKYQHLGYEFDEADNRMKYYNIMFNNQKLSDNISISCEKTSDLVESGLIEIWKEQRIDLYVKSFDDKFGIVKIIENKNEALKSIRDTNDTEIKTDKKGVSLEEFFQILNFDDDGNVSFKKILMKNIYVENSCRLFNRCNMKELKNYWITKDKKITACTNKLFKLHVEGKANIDNKILDKIKQVEKSRKCDKCGVTSSCSKCVINDNDFCNYIKKNTKKIQIAKYYFENRIIIKNIYLKHNDAFFNYSQKDQNIIEFQDKNDQYTYKVNKKLKKVFRIKSIIK